ncbi:RAB6-interacting golgin [Antennarius striatus]|uniref:RAB6-interacting golgin n=1 Tax=Antennarius striatus TaxID=241820 RepID=UPI0035B39F0D
MSGWAGFSEEELRKLQQKDSAMSTAAARGRKPAPGTRSRQQLQRERALQLAAQRNQGATSPSLPPEQQLTKPPPKEEPVPPAVTPTGTPPQKPVQVGPTGEHQQVPEEEIQTVKELEKPEVELREKTRLEQLQQEQTVMEEMNKRKKALLAKTIAEKSKQTRAETLKLNRIQKELQALDDMVSSDIGILRDLIEQSSWNYSAARKRYEKAEAEFVSAKLDLHRKTEVKEQLTEHLCAVIQQNERRKAQKLEELMEQLQLHEDLRSNQEEPDRSARDCTEEEQPINQPNNQLNNEPIDQPNNEPIDQPNNEPIDQPINPLVNPLPGPEETRVHQEVEAS